MPGRPSETPQSTGRASDGIRPTPGRRLLRVAVWLVAAVIMVDALFGDRGLVEMLHARREYRSLQAMIGQLKQENARLRDEARRLREDPATIEKIARKELGLVKPGEILFIVKDVPSPSRRPR